MKNIIAGVDEVGRGSLVGPVYAAAVILKKNLDKKKLKDSKKLTKRNREILEKHIKKNSYWSIGSASLKEIEKLNILNASLLAMKRAIRKLNKKPSHILIDGNKIPKQMPCPAQAIVKGDSKHLEIAAASILAKVGRDRIMHDLHTKHPEYGWNTNSGYGSKTHMQAIEQHGVTIHHRRSFSPVRAALAA